jgi:nucleotide-binding universal stress UspA family protein
MIETIVVAVDGSEHARKAAELAGDLGARYGAKLVLVTVALPPSHLPEGLRRMAESEHLVDPEGRRLPPLHNVPGETMAALRDFGESDLDEAASIRISEWILDYAASRAKEHGAERVRKRLETGDPVTAILRAAQEEHADLIVCGSRGLSALGSLLMGSVSHKLCQLARCSCITVK